MPYNSSVLINNWQEDKSKAPPLHGGIPDLGFREYKVTYREEFIPPPAGATVTFKNRKDRYGLVCKDTINEAAFSMGEAGLKTGGFDTTLGGGARLQTKDETIAQYRTNMQDAVEAGAQFGRTAAIRTARDAEMLAHSEYSKPAGGAPSVNIDRGKHTAGISGEMLVLGGDAKKNTIAQRSWTYGPDPGLKYTLNPPKPREEVTGMSLHIRGIPPSAATADPGSTHGKYAAFQAKARSSTDVTAASMGLITKAGKRVFLDDP